MKLEFNEHQGCFEFSMTPETLEDCAMLARFALNCTKEVRSIGATAYRDKSMAGHLVLGKRRNETGDIKHD